MSAPVLTLPAHAKPCPSCDGAMSERRGLYRCGYCRRLYEIAEPATLTSTSGKVVSSVRVWVRLSGAA